MEAEMIAAVKLNPNITMVTDQEVYDLIAPGGALENERVNILRLLEGSRKTNIESWLRALQLQEQFQERYLKIKNQEGAGFTMEQLREFVSNYPGTAEAAEVERIIANRMAMEEEMRYKACQHLAQYKQFLLDYPLSSYATDIHGKIHEIEESDDDAWRVIKNSIGSHSSKFEIRQKAITYLDNPDFERHTQEVRALLNELDAEDAREEERKLWAEAVEKAMNGDVKLLSEFINNKEHEAFCKEIEPGQSQNRGEWAQDLINKMAEFPTIQLKIENVLNSPNSDVDDYVHLMQQYPMFQQKIRDWMLEDMKKNAWRYQRNEMYALLFGGRLYIKDTKKEEAISPYFNSEELHSQDVLTERHTAWIQNHPTIQSDYEHTDIPEEENFTVSPNTTDVYFFGVPGCGKTSVLAGLFNAHKIEEGLSFKVIPHSEHVGFNYAQSLTASLSKDLFPKSTPILIQRSGGSNVGDDNDDKFIQIIDATITEKDEKTEHVHKISLIEMPGARTNELATIGQTEDLDKLGTGAKELLQNENSKIIFFVIDPKNTKTQPININGATVNMGQAGTLDTVADLIIRMLEKNKIKNLKAVHVIMAKSDLLPDQSLTSIKDVLKKGSYGQFMESLEAICSPNRGEVNIHCNRQPHLFTFSLGHIAPGDFVRYDDTDTKKILKVICGNTISVRSKNFWDTVMTWMNQKI